MSKKLSREELIAIVRRISECDGSETQINELIAALQKSVPDPNVTGYIFWPDQPMTPEEVVDRALAYRPLLPPT